MVKKNFFVRFLQNIEWKAAIKTGLAAGLALFLGTAFSHLQARPDSLVSGMWCVMSAIVVLQAHLGDTYQAAWIRFLGVLVGSAMGGLFTFYFGTSALTLGASVCGTILFCSVVGIKDSVRIASLSVAVVMILWGLRPFISPWTFALYRFLDSTLGILIAVFVSHTIWPEKALVSLQKNIAKTLLAMSKLYRLSTDFEEKEKSTNAVQSLILDIDETLRENREYNEAARLELIPFLEKPKELTPVMSQLETIFKAILDLNAIHKTTIIKVFDDDLQKQVSTVIDETDSLFQQSAKAIENNELNVNREPLRLALDKLHEEQKRFRETHTTRKFNLEDVESFFVFFYSLRLIGEELIQIPPEPEL